MATMRNESTRLQIELRDRTIVGRSSQANVRLSASGVSNEHASIRWDGNDWILHDLSSRNGTRVNGSLLIGRAWQLRVGDVIVFGDPGEHWLWIDGSAPEPSAIAPDGSVLRGTGGLLVLGEPAAPRASVYLHDEHWEIDLDGISRRVADADVVIVDGKGFRLSLPSARPVDSATRTLLNDRALITARATFRVSSDEEHVELTFHTASGDKRMPTRNFNYTLLTLARARLEHLAEGIAVGEAGWVYADDLVQKLQTTIENLNVDVHRARAAVARLALFDDAENLVQRRLGTGQLRLGVGEVAIATFNG